ncbi:hypothetical protein ACTVZO_42515 [Streptomyces sp. IBSNAI002]|uniref:hypothetical protein n=1 Tax=Streptomyces sp. IBSNAI002 TaxID=3457500 RepID=UPI003FCF41BE
MRDGTGTTRQRTTDTAWSATAPGAEMVGGALLFCAVLYAWLVSLAEEPYNRGFGGGIAALFWLVVMFFGSPFIVLALGYVHSFVFTTPVMVLSNLAGVRTRMSASYWVLPALVMLAAGYAMPICLLNGSSYGATLCWIAVIGIPPVAVAVFARMRQVPRRTVRRYALAPIVAAVITTFCLGAAAPAYQPPVLERADYVGEWAGDGAVLELGSGGEASAKVLPVHDGFEVVDHCSGHGTWVPAEAQYGSRAGVALAVPDCKEAELRWEVAGTEGRPELFVLLGDPDAGEVVVLRKQTG